MKKLYRFVVLLALLLATACTAPVNRKPTPVPSPAIQTDSPTSLPVSKGQIARYPEPDNYSGSHVYTTLPVYNPTSENPFQVDLRSTDLKELDLSNSEADLLHALFDSKTEWPPADKMPDSFNRQTIIEFGKDPGLGIRALHDQGITGKGVNIAIIDQPLIIDHIEYPERIKLYEEINVVPDTPSQMHGPAVASIAVGKTAGVAPDANLYYIATWLFEPEEAGENLTYKYYAQALRRIVELNKGLPDDQKIRAVSMSIGLNSAWADYDDFMSAIEEAKAAGIFAMPVDLSPVYGWNIMGLGRGPLSDPNKFQSYEPADWWEQCFFSQGLPHNTLLIPMDARTTASPTGKEDYVFYSHGGMSWTVPYLAGTYALAVQVKPDITPDAFWGIALKTGRTIQIHHKGKDYEFGVILDPPGLIKAITAK